MVAALVVLGAPSAIAAPILADARRDYAEGRYEDCAAACQEAIDTGFRNEDWPLLRAQALMTLGQYREASQTVETALARLRWSLRLRLASYEALMAQGRTADAQAILQELNQTLASRWQSLDDPASLVAVGQAALKLGADPKTVLNRLFQPALKADPEFAGAYLAIGQLALDKQDYQLAARTFDDGLKKMPREPDLHCGRARAFAPSSPEDASKALKAALEINPRHVPSLLLKIDHAIDAEAYEEAEAAIGQVLKVNPSHPEAWAYRAVLRHLDNQPEAEADARNRALASNPANPRVDWLIGRKLSQKYRFREGADRQRQALEFDPGYLPAQLQLAQDFLRLGEEPPGWELARGVQKRDPYDITAFNLVELQSSLQRFRAVTNEHFVVRMDPVEAELYGDRALALLERARKQLGERYGVVLPQPVVVEIFPQPHDFAVRTFGMPGNPGYLGVCFGRVITANSPASQTMRPVNWEAVLWHEFAHVVTLTLTHNKMPRWLSEGISVYEEQQANPCWGQRFGPEFREMVIEKELKPVSELSAAFLSPPTPAHLQLAYLQSGWVVEFIVQRGGFESLKAILADLGQGRSITEAMTAHVGPPDEVDKAFAEFALAKARTLAPALDWTRPEGDAFRRLTNGHGGELVTRMRGRSQTSASQDPPPLNPASSNYWELSRAAAQRLEREDWQGAKAPLERLVQLYPNQTGPESAPALLAGVYRRLQEEPSELEILNHWAAVDADALEAYLRLIELGLQGTNRWTDIRLNAERSLAVNPLIPQPHRAFALAAEALGDRAAAVEGWARVLKFDPPDQAEVRYRLARLVSGDDPVAARRYVLQALEQAPRYRDALRLLVELQPASAAQAGEPVTPEAAPGNPPVPDERARP